MPVKTLVDDVAAEAIELRLSDGLSLNLNDVVAIDADDLGRREIVEIAQIVMPGTASDWVRVRINQPIAIPHRRGCMVRRLQAAVPNPAPSLNYAAERGDCALLFDTTGIVGTHQIRLSDPPSRRSYHRLTVLETISDAQGFYRLPPLARAGRVEVLAREVAVLNPAQGTAELVPDYDRDEIQLDLIVS
jgi:hypothetical protein